MNTHTPADNRKTILVADDDPVFCTIISRILGAHFQVTTVSGSYTAIEVLRQNTMPDLLVMETRMPDMDGMETIKMIRENLNCHIPAIALTADCFVQEEQLLTAGFQNVMIKPVSSQLLKDLCFSMTETPVPA